MTGNSWSVDTNLVPQRRRTDKTEDRDDDEQQRINGDEAVPSERNDELVRGVVTELLDHRVGDTQDRTGSLPVVDGDEQTPQPFHASRYIATFVMIHRVRELA